MGKKVFLLFLFIFVIQFGFSQTNTPIFDEFSAIVDFTVTFEELYRHYSLKQGPPVPENKLIIIDGSIASIMVIDPEETSFIGELEVLNGRWVGLEDVEVYKCFVEVKGPNFFSRIPVRRTRKKLPDQIEVNSRVLIIGKITGTRLDNDGNTIPVLEAAFIRDL